MQRRPSRTDRASPARATRRGLMAGAAAIAAGVAHRPAHAEGADGLQGLIRVTLLGTGTPVPLPGRFGPSTLVEAGGRRLLFDAGRGAPIRLNQLQINLGSIDAVFLTHFHSDHVNALPDVWMTSYIPVGFGNRTTPLRLLGPEGTAQIAERMRAAFSDDIRIRMADEHVPEAATRIEVQEFRGEGVAFDEGGVRVTAFEVNHGPLIKPACGYRIDHAGHSVLLSGDTKYEPNIVRHGAGVDLLIHEVCAVPPPLQPLANIRQVIDHHTSPQEAGRVFSQTRPKTAAFTHFVLLGTPEHPPLTPEDVERQTRETYGGPLVLGEDLMRFTVGPSVSVQRWDAARGGYPPG